MNETNWTDAECFEDWTLTENKDTQSLRIVLEKIEGIIPVLENTKACILACLPPTQYNKKTVKQLEKIILQFKAAKTGVHHLNTLNHQQDSTTLKHDLTIKFGGEEGSAKWWKDRRNGEKSPDFNQKFSQKRRPNRKIKQKQKKNIADDKREVKLIS